MAVALLGGGCGDSFRSGELDAVTDDFDVSSPTTQPDVATGPACMLAGSPPDTPACPPLPTAQADDFWDLGDYPVVSDVACGVQEDGSYEGPCNIPMPGGRASTLCDERTKRCFRPRADCQDGWCRIPPASFVSGASADGEANMGPYDEDPDAALTVVTRGFFIQTTEMTKQAFWDLMGYCPGRPTACGPNCPVSGLSVFAAMRVANTLSEQEGREQCYTLEGCGPVEFGEYASWMCDKASFHGVDCMGYRLPSWAEFELASRAGSPFCSAWGPVPVVDGGGLCQAASPWTESAVTCSNACVRYAGCGISPKHDEPTCLGPLPVASHGGNPFGLFDTVGNVSELTHSRGTSLPTEPTTTPLGSATRDPGHDLTIGRDDKMFELGRHFYVDSQVACVYTRGAVEHSRRTIVGLGSSGFRLVRTDPDPRAP